MGRIVRASRLRAGIKAGALLLALSPAAALAQPAIGAGCEAAGSQCFQLNAVSLEGLTAYKPGELAPLYAPYLTRDVSVADLAVIAQAITDKYRSEGFFLSRAAVPPQLRGGHVARIMVYEGYISEVVVKGSGAKVVNRYLKDLSGRRPLRLADLDRRLTLAKDEPGLRIKTQLEPDLDDPAKHRLVVTAETDRVSTYVSIDNRGAKDSGPWQAYLRTAINSTLRAGDQLSLAILTVPYAMRAFAYAEIGYALPLGGAGTRLRGLFSVFRAHDGANPATVRAGSESWTGALNLFQPLWRTRKVNLWAQLSANTRHVEQDWNGGGGGYADEVRALRGMISATYSPPGNSTNLFAQVSTGERDNARTFLSRSDAAKDFSKLNLHASHYRDLGKHAGVYVTADGQWSRDRLLASEEFTAGGSSYGRGYNYAEIGGDQGIAASAEIRAGFKPDIPGVSFLQGYGFIDAARVWNYRPGGQTRDYLTSVGVGTRVRFGDRTTLGFEMAKPINRTPYDRNKAWRPFLYLSSTF